MKKHKNALLFIFLIQVMQNIPQFILLSLISFEFIQNYLYELLFVITPFVGFLTIFLAVKLFKINLTLKCNRLNIRIFFISILLIFCINIFQTTLDSTFFQYVFDNKLRFLRTNFFLENNLMFYLNFIIAVILVPIYEEIFYRRIMFEKLLEDYKPVTSVIITSILFAAVHLDLNGLIAYFVIGLAFTYIYYLTRNIWFNIFLHSVFNIIAFFTKIVVHEYGGNFFFMGIFIYVVLLILIVFSVKRITILTREKD